MHADLIGAMRIRLLHGPPAPHQACMGRRLFRSSTLKGKLLYVSLRTQS